MAYPSVKTLMTIPGLDKADALTLRKVLDGRLDPQSVDARIEHPHFGAPPSFKWEGKLRAANVLLRTFGVEWCEFECQRGQSDPEGFHYCNAGDTYNWTLLYVPGKGFRVGCWGDLIEAHERKCRTCRKLLNGG